MKSKKTTKSNAQACSQTVQQPNTQLPTGYKDFLNNLKKRIRKSQIKAVLSANKELILLYWQIGKSILKRQMNEGWGAKVIDRLANDLQRAFPEIKGFSSRNIKYMRAFAKTYPDEQFVQELLAQITWYHNLTLIEKAKDPTERLWYTLKTIEHGWSRSVLVQQIETNLYARKGKAITNFDKTLPSPQSDLAKQALKDPYVFDFLTLSSDSQERELEHGLIEHVRRFLLELGEGFAFVGQQINLEVGREDYYLDLLFYHLKLRCYVVIDLKTGPFKPEYTGKMNFYLSAVDDLMRHSDDKPTIGLILCKEKNEITAEYALRDMGKPMGVSEWKTKLVESLPKRLQGKLPTVEELKDELCK